MLNPLFVAKWRFNRFLNDAKREREEMGSKEKRGLILDIINELKYTRW